MKYTDIILALPELDSVELHAIADCCDKLSSRIKGKLKPPKTLEEIVRERRAILMIGLEHLIDETRKTRRRKQS